MYREKKYEKKQSLSFVMRNSALKVNKFSLVSDEFFL